MSPSSSYILRCSHHPIQLLNIIHNHIQLAIIILLFSATIFISQPSWCLLANGHSSNEAPSSMSDQTADSNTHQYDFVHNLANNQPTASNPQQQSLNTRSKTTVPSEQYRQNLSDTFVNSGPKLPSSQIILSHVVPPLSMQQAGSSGLTSFNRPNPYRTDSNNATGRHNRDSDSLQIEGSGDGPISGPQKPQTKFDDTEEGEDDEDDDYDYKDSLDNGSGRVSQPPLAKKPESDQVISQGNGQLKKPGSANEDAYLPFRPTTTNGKSVTTISPPLMRPTTKDDVSWGFPTAINQNNSEPEQVRSDGRIAHQNISSSENAVLMEDKIQRTTRIPPTIYKLPDNQETATPRPKQISSTTTIASPPFVAFDNQLKVPNIQASTLSPAPTKPKHHNSSPLSPARNSSKSDIDYDYEDEHDDEDSDDVSNFEDNEAPLPADNLNTPNSTISQSVPTISQQASTPSRAESNYIQIMTTTAAPRPTTMSHLPTAKPTSSNFMNYPDSSQAKYTTPNPLSTKAPPMLSPTSGSSVDYHEEDDDDSKTEEELEKEEDDDDDEDDDDEASLNHGLSSVKPLQSTSPPSITSSTPRWTAQGPSTQMPPYNDFVNEQYKPGIPFSNPPGPIKTTTQMPRVIPTSPKTMIETTSTSAAPPTTPSILTTSTTIKTTTVPTTTTTTTFAPLPPIKPTLSPLFTSSTTVRTAPIRYATTPKVRTTAPVTRISNIIPYDNRNSLDGDVELTRQIYDKAIEVYQATNKAISAAVEAVKTEFTSFEVNSVTFEPFLSQPFLFMFVLGAAVIGLVLTMMLVVYIISYQIQPKEDDVSIYSHSC